ncbi:hypothetical protein C8F01DRAFT_267845 [Mycena amicta]|nr:hypothetical protein C8F01DRAFT_267845 [Mycena amicta]
MLPCSEELKYQGSFPLSSTGSSFMGRLYAGRNSTIGETNPVTNAHKHATAHNFCHLTTLTPRRIRSRALLVARRPKGPRQAGLWCRLVLSEGCKVEPDDAPGSKHVEPTGPSVESQQVEDQERDGRPAGLSPSRELDGLFESGIARPGVAVDHCDAGSHLVGDELHIERMGGQDAEEERGDGEWHDKNRKKDEPDEEGTSVSG